MKLAGLTAAALADPALARARQLARRGDTGQVDLTAPAALRPFVAAVAGRRAARCSRSPRPAARPTTWPRRWAACSAGPGGGLPVLGDAAARAPLAPLRHGRPAARRAAPARPPGRARPMRVVVRAGPFGAPAAAQGARRPRTGRAARPAARPTSTTSSPGWPRSRTPASTWSPSAASSPSAAASSTSSRRPTSTRCGSSSGATRSRRSARFAVADQRTIDKVDRLWAPPCRELLLTDGRPRAGGRAGQPTIRSWPRSSTSWPRASRSRAWSRWPRPCSAAPTRSSCCSTACRPAPTCCSATRSGSAPGRTTWSVPATEFLRGELGRGRGRWPGADRPRRGRVQDPRRRARGRRRRSASRGGRWRPFGLAESDATGRWTSRGWRASCRTPVDVADDADRDHAVRAARPALPRRDRPGRRRPEAAGPATAGASRWSSRGTVRPSARSRCCATPASARRSSAELTGPRRGRPDRRHLRRARPRLPRRGGRLAVITGTTSPAAAARPPRTCARCRAGGATRSTRWSCAPATSSCTSSTASAGTWSWCSARSTAPTANTWSSSTRRPSAASPATGSSCRPTSSTSCPATSAASRRRCTRWAAPTGRRPSPGPARRSARSPRSSSSSTRPGRTRRATRSARTRPWQRELEDAFPYTETPDQLAAIDEVKADMEKPVPMDRLICGDVGYGKTEIAVRAAFKAVQDGKQVAVLVPTTLLAQQHFNTFSERMSAVPGRHPAAVAVPDAEGGRGRRSRRPPTARPTSSSAPTGCCRPRPGSSSSA